MTKATVIEFRTRKEAEPEKDDAATLVIVAATIPLALAVSFGLSFLYHYKRLTEDTMWMRDQKNRDERNVIHATERFTTQRRIETRRMSGMATRVIRRRRDDDGPDSAA